MAAELEPDLQDFGQLNPQGIAAKRAKKANHHALGLRLAARVWQFRSTVAIV